MVTRLAGGGDQPGKGCQMLGGAEALYVTYLRDYGEGEYRPDTGDGRQQLRLLGALVEDQELCLHLL